MPTPSGPIAQEIEPLHAPVSRGFSWTEPDANEYRYLHAELLVNQAADLLDRGSRDRAEWSELTVKWFNLNLELMEFAQLDEIHEREVRAGVYTSTARLSQAELEAVRAAATHNQAAVSQLQSQLGAFYSDAAIATAAAAASNQAYGQVVPTYGKEKRNLTDGNDHLIFRLWNGASGSREDIMMKTADFQTRQNLSSTRVNLNAQAENLAAAATADTLRDPGLEAKAKWDAGNCGFRYERTRVARDLQIGRVTAATRTGGPLNYRERMDQVRKRADLDFGESLAKLAAAAKGLRLLYGYQQPLPEPDATGVAFFDECLLWTRRSINWMVRFRQLEQSYVLPISLKKLCRDWQQSCNTGMFEFEIPAGAFAGMRHVRLRGLSVVTVFDEQRDDRASFFEAVVTAPRQSSCTHLSGAVETLDQRQVPSCRVSRVVARGNVREPDVIGATALYNASPIGAWRVTMNASSSTGVRLNVAKDVQLDLHLAFRSAGTE